MCGPDHMMTKRFRRDIYRRILTIIMAGAVMLLLSSCRGSARQQDIESLSEKYAVPGDRQLIVYTSHKEEVYMPIIREFEERTGIWVELHTGGTTQMFDEVRQVMPDSGCDIMFGGGIESYEASKDLFMPFEAKEKDVIDAAYVDPDNLFTAFTELPIVFVYNKKLVSYSEVPKSWEELFDERWKGQIAFADIHNSGTSYTILSTMSQLFDETPDTLVERFVAQLGGRILTSSGNVIPKVSDGEFLIGITLEETARKAMEQGGDISMLYPSDGTSAVPDGVAIVKNAPHSYNAGRFIDFVVGYDTQRYVEENFYRRSVRTDIAHTGYGVMKRMDFDLKESSSSMEEVFLIWDEKTGREGE